MPERRRNVSAVLDRLRWDQLPAEGRTIDDEGLEIVVERRVSETTPEQRVCMVRPTIRTKKTMTTTRR